MIVKKEHHSRSKTILLIEDDNACLKLINDAFATFDNYDYALKIANTFGEVLQQLDANDIDLIVLSIGSLDKNPFSIFEKINAIASDIPTIVLANQHDTAFALKVINSGRRGFLVKSQASLNAELFAHNLRVIIEHLEIEERLYKLSRYDALTNLPTQLLFQEMLEKALFRAKRNGLFMTVLYVDLDNFKKINDSLGHDVGNILLKEVAARLQASVRKSDFVARLGGDEFAFILEDIKNPNDSFRAANRISHSLNDAFFICGHEIFASCSIGIATFPLAGETPDLLVRHADLAMYQAKKQGRCVCAF